MAECGTCHAPVVWATVDKSGKRIALDPEPVAGGTIILREPVGEAPPVAHITTKKEREMVGETLEAFEISDLRLLYRAHFSSCPDADKHRRR